MTLLAPAVPAEATFEEMIMVNEISSLMPVTPSEATFEDISGDLTSPFDLAPVAPIQADFE
jgi:hypothetical protein